MAKRGSASSRFAKLIRHFNFQQRTVVDPNTQEEIIEEIPVLESVSLEASTDVTVAGEQVVTTSSQYVNDEQISESSVTQHQAALSITGSQISDLQNYLTTSFPSGTRMLFQQTTAPTGWTKDTTHNNKALRVTSGTAGTGGSSAFNTVFGITATNNHTLTAAQMPSHSHNTNNTGGHSHNTDNTGSHSHSFNRRGLYSGGNYTNDAASGANGSGHTWAQGTNSAGAHSHNTNNTGGHSHNTNNAGSGEAHSHGIDLRVHYVDVIIATKD